MNLSKKTTLPAAAIAFAAVTALQLFLYEGEVTLAQASFGSIPVELIAEILITIAVHLFVILMIPLLLIARKKIMLGYAVLALSLAAYVQIKTGLSLTGVVLTAIALSALAFHGVARAFAWVRYLRTK